MLWYLVCKHRRHCPGKKEEENNIQFDKYRNEAMNHVIKIAIVRRMQNKTKQNKRLLHKFCYIYIFLLCHLISCSCSSILYINPSYTSYLPLHTLNSNKVIVMSIIHYAQTIQYQYPTCIIITQNITIQHLTVVQLVLLLLL